MTRFWGENQSLRFRIIVIIRERFKKGGGRGRQGEKHQYVVPLIYAFIG